MPPYILVVDDDDGMRYALFDHFRSLGYEVAQVPDGADALRSIAHRKPDLVLLDVMMDKVSGWEVLEILQSSEKTSDIRVIVLTALGQDRDEADGWILGCDWYEVKEKPLQFDDLSLVVERLLAIDPHANDRRPSTA